MRNSLKNQFHSFDAFKPEQMIYLESNFLTSGSLDMKCINNLSCNNNGYCNRKGICECFRNYEGTFCSIYNAMSTNIFPKLKEVETVIINKQENVITHKTHIQRVSQDLINNQFNDILNVENLIDRQTLILNDNNFFHKKGINTKLINMGENQRNTKKDNQVNLKLILTNDQIEASRKVAIQKEEDFLKKLKTRLLLRQPKKPTKQSEEEEEEEEDNDKPTKPKDSKPPKIGSIAPLQNTSTKPITSSPKSTKTSKESEEKPTEEKKIPKTQNVTKSVNLTNGKNNEEEEDEEEDEDKDKKKLNNSI